MNPFKNINLKTVISEDDKKLFNKIVEEVADIYSITPLELKSKSTLRKHYEPRLLSYAILSKHLTVTQISILYNRTQPAITTGIKRFKGYVEYDFYLRENFINLEK